MKKKIKRILYRIFLKLCNFFGSLTGLFASEDQFVLCPSLQKNVIHLYEPKRKFRWLFEIDGIDSFTIKNAERPNSVHNLFQVQLYDPVSPSACHKIRDWEKSKEARKATLKMLDPFGDVVERWDYEGVEIEAVYYGTLDYSDSEPCIITLTLKYSSVELT